MVDLSIKTAHKQALNTPQNLGKNGKPAITGNADSPAVKVQLSALAKNFNDLVLHGLNNDQGGEAEQLAGDTKDLLGQNPFSFNSPQVKKTTAEIVQHLTKL